MQSYNYGRPDADSHFSTSSSVYSPLDGEFPHLLQTQKRELPKNPQRHRPLSKSLLVGSLNSHLAKERSLSQSSLTNSLNKHLNQLQLLHHRRLSSLGSSASGGTHHRMPHEESSNSFHTYVTADDFSLGSINDSIMHDRGIVPDAEVTLQDSSFDNDATPIIRQPGYMDPIDDATPVIAEDSTFPLHQNQSQFASQNQRKSLPQQELSKKFKRLSMTLQQLHQHTSGESVQFIHSFQQNVEKVNNDPDNQKIESLRTSLYYRKITEKQAEDDQRSQFSRDTNDDQHQPYYNSHNNHSNSSKIEQPTYLAGSGQDDGKSVSSSSYTFNADSVSHTSSTRDSVVSSYSDFKGSRTSPTKSLPSKSKAPVRQDLVKKFEESSPNRDIFYKAKNSMIIKAASTSPVKEPGMPLGLNINYSTTSVLDPRNVSSIDDIEEVEDSDEDSDEEAREDDNTQPKQYPKAFLKGNYRNSATSAFSNFDDYEEEDLSTLFVKALHTFDSSTLQLESDASICLSFEKDDMAFVHTIDESGWGEVTLINTLQRGWIPMNYFTIAVGEDKDDNSEKDDLFDDDEDNDISGKIPNSIYLKPLFHACGKFLMNPLSHRNRRDRYTFSIRVINSIRDGVRILLQETDCLSRSNEIVTKRPVVRKARKSLLADWYNLMLKADQFKGTSNFHKIEVLTLMVYQVSRKAVNFLQIWSTESRQIIKKENEKRLQNDMNNYPLLSTPPQAKARITELNGLLYSYLGMIVGRLDLIEHNPIGCEILESITHQIILLLRELLFISKTGSDFSSEKPDDLDGSLDTLLGLVSDLVSGVKCLVVKTLNETDNDMRYVKKQTSSLDYFYTQEGGELIQIASKMIKSIGSTIVSIRKLLDVTGDFRLNAERAYPDYSKMRIDPDDLIRKCSLGIAKAQDVKNRDLKEIRKQQQSNANKLTHSVSRNSVRFSMMRSGKTGELGFTESGANILHDVLVADIDGSSPFSISNAVFEPFSNTDPNVDSTTRHDIKDELLVDDRGNLLGASFKGLVYTLTNEQSPPEYFFVSTFFICFRSFANGIDLIEELITRFDIAHGKYPTATGLAALQKGNSDISSEVRLKNRRRLIAKMFQLWMESYWNQEADNSLLTTLINFFNECLSIFLPLDAIKLIEIAAKLSSKPLIESQQKIPKKNRIQKQIINRNITITRMNRKNSILSISIDNSARYSMVDGYELSKINTNSSTQTSISANLTLAMPLGIGNQTLSSSTLLSKSQITTIEKVNLTYRAILGASWCNPKFIDPKSIFIPLELKNILPNWYNICDQSWVLSSYRPNLLDFNGLEIAKQLTLIESQIFCTIKPDELLNENYTAKRAHLKLAPNIRQSLLFTNCLSGYVLESTLQPKISQKMRVNIVKTWLKVAISCLYLRNFNSLAAIITSLESHLVTRLHKIWEELSTKYKDLYDYLSGIVHPDKNYTVYRSKLRNFLVANEYNVPIVPYFSLFLQDLTFVMDGNPNYRKANSFLNQKLINIDKYLKVTRIIADIESLQTPYASEGNVNNPQSASNKRNTLFSLSGVNSGKSNEKFEDYQIISVPAMQELILLELWKVCQLNRKEDDRAWKLSCVIQPREANKQ